jgi:hypothetical protein
MRLYWVGVWGCQELSDCPHSDKEHDMSKAQKTNKEGKKQPLLNPKEKRVAKQLKKDGKDAVHTPFLSR